MTNSKSTKRALTASMISLLLCIAMLIGTTFAWFTDTVTTGKNKIVAGNLDVELYVKDADSDSYVAVDETTSLFDESALWEPGYTQVVYLKVANVGALALKYQLAVNVISEQKGTNVAGEEFSLSDYLVFGQAVNAAEVTYATRQEAWAAAGNQKGLNDYSDAGVLLPDAEEYMALVVYMPTDVGNEANYMTETTPPAIDLGVTLIATQTPYESDSFDHQYDAKADGTPDHNFGAITTTGTKVTSPVVVDDVTMLKNEDATAVVSVPYAAVAENASSLTLSMEETETPANITVSADQASKAYEVTVSGIEQDNTTPITFSMFIGKNLTNVTVYHYTDTVSDAVYDSDTGFVTLTTTSFSPFTAVFDQSITVLDAQTLHIVSSIDGMQITLGADITTNTAFTVPEGVTVSLDLGGHSLTATSNSCIINNGNITSITNGTLYGKYYGIVAFGAIGEVNVNVNVDGNNGTGTATAIYVDNGGSIENITGGEYHAYPEVFGSSIIMSPCIYVWTGRIGEISAGTFQSVGKTLRIAKGVGTVDLISGGIFKAPYVDTTTMAAYSNTYLQGGITWGTGVPTSVTGGTFYNIAGDHAMSSTYNITKLIPADYEVVEAYACEETAHLRFVAYDATTKTRAHFVADETAPVYYYYTVQPK